MRFLVGLLVLALLAPATHAAPLAIDLRMGDAPATDFREADNAWHISFGVEATHTQGTPTTISVPAYPGALAFEIYCSCQNPAVSGANGTIAITVPAEQANGTYNAGFVVPQGTGKAVSYNWQPNTLGHDATVRAFAPEGYDVLSSATGATSMEGTTTVTTFESASLGSEAWFIAGPAVAPATVTATQTAGPTPGDEAGSSNVLGFIGAFIAGLLVWALLVQRGMVQKRSRKQVVAQASHKLEASSASTDVLEARKRALMAGLKDLEKAKMMGEMDQVAYDTVKADLKKQTVTVMRALEEQKES